MVPISNTQHPNGVTRIIFVRVLCSTEEFPSLLRQLETVVGSNPISGSSIDENVYGALSDSDAVFTLTTPDLVTKRDTKLILSTPRHEREAEDAKKGARIHDIGLEVRRPGSGEVDNMKVTVRNEMAALVPVSQW